DRQGQARLDRAGDPLPDGALDRFGTVRFRTSSAVTALAFSADGKFLVSAHHAGKPTCWDVATGRVLGEFLGHSSNVLVVAVSPDGRLLASGSADKTVRLWDAAPRKELHRHTGHQRGPAALVF